MTEVMHICHLDWTRSMQQTAAEVKKHIGPSFTISSIMLLVMSSAYKLLSALEPESKVKYITRFITLHEKFLQNRRGK